MLMISPKPAQYIEKDTAFNVNKNGYIVVDFTPFDT